MDLPTKIVVLTNTKHLEKAVSPSKYVAALFPSKSKIVALGSNENAIARGKKIFLTEKNIKFAMRDITLDSTINLENKAEVLKRIHKKTRKKLSKREIVEDLKNQIFVFERLYNPDYLFIEASEEASNVKESLLFSALKEIEEERGRSNLIYVHVARLEDNFTKKLPKNTYPELLEVNITPDIVINGMEINWVR